MSFLDAENIKKTLLTLLSNEKKSKVNVFISSSDILSRIFTTSKLTKKELASYLTSRAINMFPYHAPHYVFAYKTISKIKDEEGVKYRHLFIAYPQTYYLAIRNTLLDLGFKCNIVDFYPHVMYQHYKNILHPIAVLNVNEGYSDFTIIGNDGIFSHTSFADNKSRDEILSHIKNSLDRYVENHGFNVSHFLLFSSNALKTKELLLPFVREIHISENYIDVPFIIDKEQSDVIRGNKLIHLFSLLCFTKNITSRNAPVIIY